VRVSELFDVGFRDAFLLGVFVEDRRAVLRGGGSVKMAAGMESALGASPSVHPLSEQKLYSVVNEPPGVILKIVPAPLAPPFTVVPYRFPSVPWISAAWGLPPSN
jgi:hypothetical protein